MLFKFIIVFLPSCLEPDRKENNNPHNDYFLTTEELKMLEEGDIIMRQGYGLVSSIILKLLKEDMPVSHIGIIAKNDYGKYEVIHSISQSISDYDGMQHIDLKTFVKQSRPNSIIVTRYAGKNTDGKSGKNISNKAKNYLYRKIPFDHKFNLNDTTAFYCSELIWKIIFELFDDDVFDINSHSVYLNNLGFKAFYSPERFEIIINHHQIQDRIDFN